MESLKKIVRQIDHKGYKAYKRLKGQYAFGYFDLLIDHVQGDPFASPSKLRVRVKMENAGFKKDHYSCRSRRIALQDYISRQFSVSIKKIAKGRRGTGKSGIMIIDSGGQEIIERTSCLVTGENVEVRFYAGLPARGRTILGQECIEMLCFEIPQIVKKSMIIKELNTSDLSSFIDSNEDQEHLRKRLRQKQIVSFIRDGSILPRKSGISQKPMPSSKAVSFKSPEDLCIEIEVPNEGKITGMGIPRGVTLIIGGGFHGKSTVLDAIEKGVYNHIPGDGREYVSTDRSAVKIRAEEGRSIKKVDISPFIDNLPLGRDTVEFSTSNASGSTSQASNIIEALETGSRLLLLDEDTSATNFLIRDEVMQKIVPKSKEPITPFIDRIGDIYKVFDTSSVLVMGGAGDYFEVADTVIFMDNYLPYIVTRKAKEIIKAKKEKRKIENPKEFKEINHRRPLASTFDPYRGRRKKIKSRGLDEMVFGSEDIDLSSVEQLVDNSQLNAILDILIYALKVGYIDEGKTRINDILIKVFEDIKKNGLDILAEKKDSHPGSLALPRKYEVAAAINRLRTLKVIQQFKNI